MDEAPLVAEGTESTVEIAGRKVIPAPPRHEDDAQAWLRPLPRSHEFRPGLEDPSKKVIAAALAENKELAKVIAGAVKGSGSAPLTE